MTEIAQHEAAASTATPHTMLVLAVLATMLSNLEIGLVNVALPILAATFDVGPTTVQWVAIAYQLAIIGALVPFGRIVDLVGSRAIYLVGMATVTLASILAALSFHVLWLILSRGLLGLGAAMLLATSQVLAIEAYPEDRRGKALGVMHMAVAGGLMAGPALGGVIVTLLGWRWIFIFPVGVTVVALWLGWRTLPQHSRQEREPIDVAGAALIVITAVLLVWGLIGLTARDSMLRSVLLLVAAAGFGTAFAIVEHRQEMPLVDLRMFQRWELSAGLLAAFLTFIALASNMFLIPFALQDVMGHSAATAGLIMMTVPLVILPVAPTAGILADKLGSRLPTSIGLMAIVLSIVAMAQFDVGTPAGRVIAVLALYGLGAGLFQAPNNSAVLSAAPKGREGIASGMLALSRNLGQVTGIAVATTIWAWRLSADAGQASGVGSEGLSAALGTAFLALAGFGVLALGASLLRPSR